MAEYIEREALLERLIFKRDMGDIEKKKYSGLECAISQVKKQTTADVVSRAYFDAAITGQETLQKYLAKVKHETAKEIFAEVERFMSPIAILSTEYAELKKKYTEGENER